MATFFWPRRRQVKAWESLGPLHQMDARQMVTSDIASGSPPGVSMDNWVFLGVNVLSFHAWDKLPRSLFFKMEPLIVLRWGSAVASASCLWRTTYNIPQMPGHNLLVSRKVVLAGPPLASPPSLSRSSSASQRGHLSQRRSLQGFFLPEQQQTASISRIGSFSSTSSIQEEFERDEGRMVRREASWRREVEQEGAAEVDSVRESASAADSVRESASEADSVPQEQQVLQHPPLEVFLYSRDGHDHYSEKILLAIGSLDLHSALSSTPIRVPLFDRSSHKAGFVRLTLQSMPRPPPPSRHTSEAKPVDDATPTPSNLLVIISPGDDDHAGMTSLAIPVRQ